MKKETIFIQGMHCRSCEILIEDELVKIQGVKKVDISHKSGTATIYHTNKKLSLHDITQAVSSAGYSLGQNNERSGVISSNKQDYIDLGFALAIATILFFIVRELGFFNISVDGPGGYGNLAVVALVGITAGISTCMALVGGLVLGISARFTQSHPEATGAQKFIPHIFFNVGRVGGFFLLGGFIGMLGGAFQLSTGFIGALTMFIGVVMLFLGLQLIAIFPRLNNLSFTLPKSISRTLGITEKTQSDYSHIRSLALGVLTFFLPCGFTQALQLYAISTGSFLKGALVMVVFALGTVPGLLGVGGVTSLVKGSFARTFFKFAGVVVVGFAIFNVINGLNLFRVGIGGISSAVSEIQVNDPNVKLENGYQIVHMVQDDSGYSPNSITVKKGIPVKWIVKSTFPYSCASSLIMPKYNIRTLLTKEEQTLEFIPKEAEPVPFSCSMGMYTGVFNVIN